MLIDLSVATNQMIELLRAAARQEILPRFGAVQQHPKAQHGYYADVVTEADLGASRYLLNHLQANFPGSFTEEELEPARFEHDWVWEIDPLDGTREFCAGMEDGYGMLAALLHRQPDGSYQPVIGITYLPVSDTLVYNDSAGRVHYLVAGQERSLQITPRSPLKGYIRTSDPSVPLEHWYHSLASQLGLKATIVHAGGATAVHQLLNNSLNLFIINHDFSSEWDIAACQPVVRALGGWVCDFFGNDFTYNRTDTFNRNGFIISIVYRKEEIIPRLPVDLLIHTQ